MKKRIAQIDKEASDLRYEYFNSPMDDRATSFKYRSRNSELTLERAALVRSEFKCIIDEFRKNELTKITFVVGGSMDKLGSVECIEAEPRPPKTINLASELTFLFEEVIFKDCVNFTHDKGGSANVEILITESGCMITANVENHTSINRTICSTSIPYPDSIQELADKESLENVELWELNEITGQVGDLLQPWSGECSHEIGVEIAYLLREHLQDKVKNTKGFEVIAALGKRSVSVVLIEKIPRTEESQAFCEYHLNREEDEDSV